MSELAFLADFFSTTIAIFLTFITCAGWGYVTARLCRLKILYISLEQIWIGFAVVLAIVGVLHFFIAINWITSSTLLAAGIFFFIHQAPP